MSKHAELLDHLDVVCGTVHYVPDYIEADDDREAELLSQFVREAGRIVSFFCARDLIVGGDCGEFRRLLEAVRQIDWIEK